MPHDDIHACHRPSATDPDGISQCILDDGRQAIIKRRHDAPPGFFAAEARGLELLRQAGALRVPEVWAHDRAYLMMEDLGNGRPSASDWQQAGHALARQHARHGEHFGLDHGGWCGDTAQDNTPDEDGWRFFAERRLQAQASMAARRGLLEAQDQQGIERLCDRLRELVPEQPPSLLHGDLWTANLHACANGELALIDAGAVHHGWHEAELAMLTLFGEPPGAFFAAYQEASSCDPHWRQRAPIYNLYHRLNHLNLFGTSYLAGVRKTLRRFAR